MTKQEEIREVIDSYVNDDCLYVNKDCEFQSSYLQSKFCSSCEGAYKCLMNRLTELGVVIKVEKELPKPPRRRRDWHGDFRSLDEDDLMLYRDAQGSVLRAGYEAVESLIQKDKEEAK